ncbi:hypothetical protein L916_19622 [Phytophthora nicotianae]|uniref:Uncharacterized protein n=3 Tax=Phytophthora nicotianae TaxID=4792 RepID=V9E1K9_PHYNI|nr:hypothetical protein F443_20290 [Phytophthora nicotianae P1569]ETL26758.1 hypothetical protein L916_19622 [Phytophthora nicotianae]ETO61729.1 hypothetical protein F444_20303 [Phytophthora nicotianae P1976]
MGRRGVQQLTAEQWREALEQQIREKEQQKEQQQQRGDEVEGPQRRSHSAPKQQEESGGLIPIVPELERAITTSNCIGQMEGCIVAGRRRCFQPQSREDYLKALQEQIEEKKRLAHETQHKGNTQQRRMSRSEDGDSSVFARKDNCRDEDEQPRSKNIQVEVRESVISDVVFQDRARDVKPSATPNQQLDESWQAPVLKAEIAADPVAITKLVDFCEELKKQNEDVKRQLSEQHAVLASLHSTLSIEADGKASAGSRRRDSMKERSDNALTASRIKKSQLKGPDTKPAVALPVAPRPRPERGKTKIPLPRQRFTSSLRSVGADIVKRLASKEETQSQKAEAMLDPFASAVEVFDEKKALPVTSQSKSVFKEEHSDETKTRDCIQSQDADIAEPKNEEGGETSSSKKACEVIDISDSQVTQTGCIEEESPMDAESKLVHDWESISTSDQLLDCTSVSILDGLSSLIPIDQSVSRLF